MVLAAIWFNPDFNGVLPPAGDEVPTSFTSFFEDDDDEVPSTSIQKVFQAFGSLRSRSKSDSGKASVPEGRVRAKSASACSRASHTLSYCFEAPLPIPPVPPLPEVSSPVVFEQAAPFVGSPTQVELSSAASIRTTSTSLEPLEPIVEEELEKSQASILARVLFDNGQANPQSDSMENYVDSAIVSSLEEALPGELVQAAPPIPAAILDAPSTVFEDRSNLQQGPFNDSGKTFGSIKRRKPSPRLEILAWQEIQKEDDTPLVPPLPPFVRKSSFRRRQPSSESESSASSSCDSADEDQVSNEWALPPLPLSLIDTDFSSSLPATSVIIEQSSEDHIQAVVFPRKKYSGNESPGVPPSLRELWPKTAFAELGQARDVAIEGEDVWRDVPLTA